MLRKQSRVTKVIAKEIIISHRARMDIWTSSARTKIEGTAFKDSLIAFYGCAHPTDTDLVKCMVLDAFFPRHLVRASHIWKHCTEGEGLKEFGLEPRDLSNPRNGILMCNGIEQAFDVKKLCFLINRITSENLFVKVLDPALLDLALSPIVCEGSITKICDIDGNQLRCPLENLPFRRILDFHAKCSYEKAINKGWIEQDSSFEDFFDMSVGSSIPDLQVYQDISDSDLDCDV